MTLRARLFGLFPTLWLLTVFACTAAMFIAPGAASVLGLLAMIYVVPVLCYRAHNAVWPLIEGRSRLDTPAYSPWWGGHQFQIDYAGSVGDQAEHVIDEAFEQTGGALVGDRAL